jgi:hypothetical protein
MVASAGQMWPVEATHTYTCTLTGHISKIIQAFTCSIMSSMQCGRLADVYHFEIYNVDWIYTHIFGPRNEIIRPRQFIFVLTPS